jgi:ubiquinone/menaquinone biosynthesis C-methylase UbiE
MRTRTRQRLLSGVLFFVTLFIPAVAPAQSGSGISSDKIFEALLLKEGMTACEIGAGDGSLSIAAARLVGPGGRVYTSELGESRVKSLREHVERSRLAQITVVDGDPNKTNFPDGACDAVFMRNVYHHFDDPTAMDASISRSLKSGARVAVIDFRPRGHEAERPQDRDGDNGTHGVGAASVERELKAAGFEPVSSTSDGAEGFMVVFSKGA